jgi:PPM family protein phosphatase
MPDWFVPALGCVIAVVLVYLASRESAAPMPVVAPAKPKGAAAKKATAATPPEDSVQRITVEAKAKRSRSGDEPKPAAGATDQAELPTLEYEEDEDVDPTRVGATKARTPLQAPTKRILYDEDAENDEPTHPGALILVTATAQTDKGLRRKRNEDNLLVMADEGVFVVADGMGGYRGGEIASELAVKNIEEAFKSKSFPGEPHDAIPARASELARAVQIANEAILDRATENKELEGMGTTVVAARFSPNKQRLYVAHVGDSRMYRLREGKLRQMTSDHTMKDLGVTGAGAAHLSRAVGVWPTVPVDILLGKPLHGDVYLLCSDGLNKMIDDHAIAKILAADTTPATMVEELVTTANARGGKDNITVILVRVYDAKLAPR